MRRLDLQQLEAPTRHSETSCTYTIVRETDGAYLQVDTYGSSHRSIPGKKSQSIRFSPEAIKQLKRILAEHFA